MKPLAASTLSALVSRFGRSMRQVLSRAPKTHAARMAAAEEVCRRAAAGDLEARITDVDGRTRFGRLCQSINGVLDTADAFTREAAAAMDKCSRDRFHRPILLRGMHGSYESSARIINAAAARMRVHSENVAFAAEQARTTASNVHTVAAACEELNATTHEISGQTSDATKKAAEMSVRLKTMGDSLARLESAVSKIDKVVELLNSVTLQTQLLGLNAAVEAAHAGEHGAGFGVVAGEVKALSDETRKATDEISTEIHRIQTTAREAASTVAGIREITADFVASAEAIDVSLREQVKAAGSISDTIMKVSVMSDELSQRISATKITT